MSCKCIQKLADMSDEQKRVFDEKLDKVLGKEIFEGEVLDQPEKVLKKTK